MINKMEVSIGNVKFKNPVVTASGTFGSGKEFEDLIDLNKLGAITVKGISLDEWKGNKPPRIIETYGGMLNSVGLQNKGVDHFIANELKYLEKIDTKVIANVCGHTIDEYIKVIEKLNDTRVDLLELNISCPNLDEGGMAFGTNTENVKKIVSKAKKVAKKPLVVKLSPNVTNIVEIAKVAEKEGADALTLINTVIGMKIDINRKVPYLKNRIGGLSGPCIKPIAIRMVYEVSRNVKIPIIGTGGISNTDDCIEFLLAGATLTSIGTANFFNPLVTMETIDGLEKYLVDNNIDDIKVLIGACE